MLRLWKLAIAVLLTIAPSLAQAANAVSITSHGWTVTADIDQFTLTIASDKIGNILQSVRLNVQTDSGFLPLKGWVVEEKKFQGRSISELRNREPAGFSN
ncbi:MAG: hypothetical protein LAP13_24350 [Acidobacteriia bacterium]|nr:hypothetical protein [Terriglobia bacterium]